MSYIDYPIKPITYRVAGLPSSGNIVISEFVAKNDTGVRDENGDRDDWIELTNTSGQPVSVSGMYLTDNAGNPNKWQIPAGYTLQPGQTLHVWADDEGTQGPLHANFKLSAAGEEVALFDTDGKTNLDWIGFGAQVADVSTGRPFGFSGVTVTYPAPTALQANRPEPCGHLRYDGIGGTAQFALTAQGTPTVGTTITYAASQAPPSTPGLVALSIAPAAAPVASLGALLVNLTGAAVFGIATDGAGAASLQLPIPNAPVLAGATFYFQAFVYDGSNGGFSNAVATRVCP